MVDDNEPMAVSKDFEWFNGHCNSLMVQWSFKWPFYVSMFFFVMVNYMVQFSGSINHQ